ncbi:hypothetical protein D3C78_1491760 [compost metagenome]
MGSDGPFMSTALVMTCPLKPPATQKPPATNSATVSNASRRPQLRARDEIGSSVRQASSTAPCMASITTLSTPHNRANGVNS